MNSDITMIVVDLETTGINPQTSEITEIGALKIKGNEIIGTYSQLIDPKCRLSAEIQKLTGITDAMLEGQPVLDKVLPDFLDFSEDCPIIGHNILFDFSFLKYQSQKRGLVYERKGIDTLKLATYYLPDLPSKSLSYLVEYFEIQREQAHRAFDDAKATFEIYQYFKNEYMKSGEESLFVPSDLRWKAKKTSPMTPRQKRYLTDLVEKHKIEGIDQLDHLTKSEASRKIDEILFKYGRQ